MVIFFIERLAFYWMIWLFDQWWVGGGVGIGDPVIGHRLIKLSPVFHLPTMITFGVDKSNRNTNASNIYSAQTSAFRSQTPELDWFENCAQWKEEIQHRLGISDSLTNITFPATPTIPVGLGVVVMWKGCSKEVHSLLCFLSCIYGLTTFMTL